MTSVNDHKSSRRHADQVVNHGVGEADNVTGVEEQGDFQRLMQENRTYSIQSLMQDAELTGRRDAVEEVKHKYDRLYRNYAALFNFAPIGYLTINRDGVIDDINLTAAIMLNAPRSSLTKRSIVDYIHHDDQDGFYYQKLLCQKKEDTQAFELKMKRADGFLFDAQLQMQLLSPHYGEEPCFSVTLMDISEHVQLSSSYALQQQCLEIATTVNDMHSLLQLYVRTVKAYLKCDAVGIRLRDEGGNIPYQAYDGFSQAFYESESPLSLHTDQCMCIAVINQTTDPDRFYFTPNGSFYINGTSRFLATVPAQDLKKTRNTCNAHGYESVALVPISVDNTVHGLIHAADRRENFFPLRLVEILETVGARLGLAIQRFHLQEQLNETVDTLHHLSSHLLTVQEDEQRRIAMELHDGCGQDLNVLKLRLKGLQRRLPVAAADIRGECDQLMTHVDKIINDIRNLAHGLKPAALDALGLFAAVRQIAREFSTNTGIQVETQLESLDGVNDPNTKVCLFRIFQEALTNIAKHARATWVAVTAERDGDNLRLRIEDNGIGFDTRAPSEANGADRGMGLSAMALRCRMINATLRIDSEAGRGTHLKLSVPCPVPETTS